MLASSPLTRAFQTLQVTSKACRLVGPLHHRDGDAIEQQSGDTDTIIYCHPGSQESTAWPQDFPALVDQNGVVSYINMKGGQSNDSVEILGEKTVSLAKMVWAEGAENKWVALQDRLDAVVEPPDLGAIKEAARQARLWLRGHAERIFVFFCVVLWLGVLFFLVCLLGG